MSFGTFLRGILIFAIGGALAYTVHYYRVGLPVVTGYGAKHMCSSVFLADRNEQQIRDEDLGVHPMKYATYKVNYKDMSVKGSVFGLAERKAIYRPGLGATLVNDFTEDELRQQTFRLAVPPNIDQDQIPWPMGNRIDNDPFPTNINRTRLNEAIEELFIERDSTKLKRTRAVVIVYDGQLIAERYAAPFSSASKFLGWSMTKSVINALIGILVREGALNIDQSAPVPEWQNENDPRRSITLKHLLTQTSGIDFNEDYYARSDVTQMLFDTGDMAAFAASHSLKHKPGTVCYYNSGTTNLLSRIIRHTVGEDEYHSFPYRKLFHQIGMNNFVLEVDASGTFVGSSYSWGTARDWARFGLLYLNRGVFNGQRVLDEHWIEQSIALAGSNQYGEYGFHIWLNTGKSPDPSTRRLPNAPADMFMFSGFDGQAVFVIPSKKLVVVRLGLTQTPGGEYGANEFLKTLISAIE